MIETFVRGWNFHYTGFPADYSIVKDSSGDLGVNSKIFQIRPTVKAISTEISKKKIIF